MSKEEKSVEEFIKKTNEDKINKSYFIAEMDKKISATLLIALIAIVSTASASYYIASQPNQTSNTPTPTPTPTASPTPTQSPSETPTDSSIPIPSVRIHQVYTPAQNMISSFIGPMPLLA